MKFITNFKQFESKNFESITLNDVSLQDIYDYLYEDDRILYELSKDRGKIITFNIIKKTYPELHDLIQFSDLYDHQVFSKPKSQFLDCFRIEIYSLLRECPTV